MPPTPTPPPTGEVLPDAGEAYACGHSLLRDALAARTYVGYCPQFR